MPAAARTPAIAGTQAPIGKTTNAARSNSMEVSTGENKRNRKNDSYSKVTTKTAGAKACRNASNNGDAT